MNSSSSSSQSYKPTSQGNAKDHQTKINGGKKSHVKLSTDAQSIAARERRHRISERFKILQSLIPGGTKMDTVSMLEEAINYVKFLKMQIWLHQTLINSVDGHANGSPDLYTSGPAPSYNMIADELPDALPNMGFPHSATSSSTYEQEMVAMSNFDDYKMFY